MSDSKNDIAEDEVKCFTEVGEGFCRDADGKSSLADGDYEVVCETETNTLCTLDECKNACKEDKLCTGIEYWHSRIDQRKDSNGTCELHRRALTRVSAKTGVTCYSYNYEASPWNCKSTAGPFCTDLIGAGACRTPDNKQGDYKKHCCRSSDPFAKPVCSECDELGDCVPCSRYACLEACRTAKECTGIEYEYGVGVCEVHRAPITNVREFTSTMHECIAVGTVAKACVGGITSITTPSPTTLTPSASPTPFPTREGPLTPWYRFIEAFPPTERMLQDCPNLVLDPCSCEGGVLKVNCDGKHPVDIEITNAGYTQKFPTDAVSDLLSSPFIRSLTIRGDDRGLVVSDGCVQVPECTRKLCDFDKKNVCAEEGSILTLVLTGSIVLVILLSLGYLNKRTKRKYTYFIPLIFGVADFVTDFIFALDLMNDQANKSRQDLGLLVLLLLLSTFVVNFIFFFFFVRSRLIRNEFSEWTTQNPNINVGYQLVCSISIEVFRLAGSRLTSWVGFNAPFEPGDNEVLILFGFVNNLIEDIPVFIIIILANRGFTYSVISIITLFVTVLSISYGIGKRSIALLALHAEKQKRNLKTDEKASVEELPYATSVPADEPEEVTCEVLHASEVHHTDQDTKPPTTTAITQA